MNTTARKKRFWVAADLSSVVLLAAALAWITLGDGVAAVVLILGGWGLAAYVVGIRP